MRITPEHTRMLMGALGAAVTLAGKSAEVENGRNRLRAMESRMAHDREIFGMKTELVKNLISALIEKRVEVVRQGFIDTLALYADQCRHYLTQQEKYADAEIKATGPLERATIRSRLSEIDLQLMSIRADAANLYREMNRVVLLIGGTMPAMPGDLRRTLVLA